MTLTKVQSGFIDLTTSAGLTVGAGSASTPALNFGDSSTGIFKSATNEVAIALSGSQKFTFKNNNFGIGTNSPDVPLTVVGDTKISGNTYIGSPTGSGARLAVYRATQYAANPVFEAYSNKTGNSQTKIFVIDGDGSVGIGTDNPGTLLELKGESSKEATVTFNRSPVQSTNDGIIGQFLFENATDSVAQISVKRESAADDAYIQFATQTTGGSYGERLRVTSAGDFQIRVDGSGGTSSQQGILRFYRTGYSNNMLDSRIVFDTSSGTNSQNDGTYAATIAGKRTTTGDGSSELSFYTCNSSNSFAAQERLRIDSDGNFGINEETPDSKLDIIFSPTTPLSSTENLIHLRTDPAGSYASRGLFVKIGRDGAYDNSAVHYDIVGSAGNSGFHVFEVQGTEKLRITKDGDVKINNGNLILTSAGTGISFINAADTATGETVTSSVLDDYEEGTYTPTLSFGDGSTGITYGANNGGSYTKIGRLVYVHVRVEISNRGSSTGGAKVKNLPFVIGNHQTGNSSVEGSFAIGGYQSNAYLTTTSTNTSAGCKLMVGTSEVELMHNNFNTGVSSNMSHSSFTSSGSFAFDLVYQVA